MLLFRASLALLLFVAAIAAPVFATTTHKKSSTTHARSSHHGVKSTKASAKSRHKLHGQQVCTALDWERNCSRCPLLELCPTGSRPGPSASRQMTLRK